MISTQIPNVTIPEYFAGKNIFVTGGNGFMGKVLIEKFLRTCPRIGNIYVLMRSTRNKTIEEKWRKVVKNALFDTIRKENPLVLKKIILVEGNLIEEGLGISKEVRKEIIEEVSFVYHLAATIRFNETLKDAVDINVRGTLEICKLVLELKKIESFMHVSTAFCQVDKLVVKEEIYPPPADWREILMLTEELDPMTLKIITKKIMHDFPNTYTFTKALAEGVVNDFCKGKIPTVIFRPTIVISTLKDPIAGWNDNLNGPGGLIAANCTGFNRSTYVNYKSELDFMPVDLAIQCIIIASWKQQTIGLESLEVYNCSSRTLYKITPRVIKEIGSNILKDIVPTPFWWPSHFITDNKFIHLIRIYLLQLIPAVILDNLLKIFGKKPILLKLQRKLFSILSALEYFIIRYEWIFMNEKFLSLPEDINETDEALFGYDPTDVDINEYFRSMAYVGLILILKQKPTNIERNKAIKYLMGAIHFPVKWLTYTWILYLCCTCIIIPQFYKMVDYLENL